jgi:hypothetical protein
MALVGLVEEEWVLTNGWVYYNYSYYSFKIKGYTPY